MNIRHVTVSASEINNNNLGGASSPYFLREIDGSVIAPDRDPLQTPKDSNTVPTCKICCKQFSKYSELSTHNGSLFYLITNSFNSDSNDIIIAYDNF
jgi:hypothetical protein